MCDNYKVDWSRIPEKHGCLLKQSPAGNLWVGDFQVAKAVRSSAPDRITRFVDTYQEYATIPGRTDSWKLVGHRHEPVSPDLNDYVVFAHQVQPTHLRNVTREALQDCLRNLGFPDNVAVYKKVAETKSVKVETVQTQLVWSN